MDALFPIRLSTNLMKGLRGLVENTVKGAASLRGNYLDQCPDREIGLLQGGLATAPTSPGTFSPWLVSVGQPFHSTAVGEGRVLVLWKTSVDGGGAKV